MRRIGRDAALSDRVEVRGVSPGAFDPSLWERGTLHWVANEPSPLLEPREGAYRNIYAPTVIREKNGWRVFYGAWDGVPTGNDRIYSCRTTDFRIFTDRRLLIDHGVYTHVCNCSALRLPDGSYRLMATAYPDRDGKNKPAGFQSQDAYRWNGSNSYSARWDDLIDIKGYDTFTEADMNGMNAILHEDGFYRLYFGDFKNFGTVFRATSRDFKTFQLDGPALSARLAVNDVKRFDVSGRRWYLMGLHMNDDRLRYSLSTDGLQFGPVRDLIHSRGEADRYIVAIGWVCDAKRVYGFLYGAGAVPSLDRNRIFASWLQRKVLFRFTDGSSISADRANGPDRVRLTLLPGESRRGRFEILAEDGLTSIYTGPETTLKPGDIWTLTGSTGR